MSPAEVTVRVARVADAAPVCRIYNPHVSGTIVTFETEPVGEAEMGARIAAAAAPRPWLIAEHGGAVVGFASACAWKSRCAFRHCVETTVYVDPEHGRRGIGARLYDELLARLAGAGMHAAIAGIALPNPASVALHARCGFVEVGHFREVGRKFDRWVDVAYHQRILDAGASG